VLTVANQIESDQDLCHRVSRIRGLREDFGNRVFRLAFEVD